jgi:hypothetical protein
MDILLKDVLNVVCLNLTYDSHLGEIICNDGGL